MPSTGFLSAAVDKCCDTGTICFGVRVFVFAQASELDSGNVCVRGLRLGHGNGYGFLCCSFWFGLCSCFIPRFGKVGMVISHQTSGA